MKKLSFLLTLLCAIVGFGQNIQIPTIIPPVPVAQNFMRYGEIPVDYSTGVPNIDIPLYTIKGSKISLPISISYHASGIKVDDIASEVGLGWVLNCSGLISRTQRGNRDEKDVSLRTYFNSTQLYTDLNNKAYDYQCTSGSLIGAYNLEDVLKNRLNDVEDLMSDRYFYQIPGGGSGVFTYDYSIFNNKQNNAIILPYRPIKIKNNIKNLVTDSFEITDENGTIYTFKSFYTDDRIVSEWYLSKIVSVDGTEEIKFNYVYQNQGVAYNRWGFVFQGAIDHPQGMYCLPSDIGASSSLSFSPIREFLTPVLSTIESNNEIINFVYDSRSDFLYLKRLKEITVLSKDSQNIIKKKIEFSAKYFNSIGNIDKRLALDYLTISAPENLNTQKYSFKYNEIGKLPPYPENMGVGREYSVDFWGYNNGAHNISNIPMVFLPYENRNSYGGDRNASSDLTIAAACMLQEIKYPTGGKTAFEFDRHYADYLYTYYMRPDAQVNIGGYIGGFRVKKISNFKSDTDINPEIKSYTYNEAIFTLPRQEYFSHNLSFTEKILEPGITGSSDTSCWSDYQRKIVYSEPFFPMEIAPGLTIMYPSVTEFIGTPTSNAGKTIYKYSIPESSVDYYNNPDHPFQFESEYFYHPYHYDKGNYVPKLVDKEIYDSSGNKVSYEHNQYDSYFETSYNTGIKLTRTKIYAPNYFSVSYGYGFLPCCNCTSSTICQAGGVCSPVIQDFLASVIAIDTKCYSKAWLLTSTLKQTYDLLDPTKYISQTIKYTYNQHNLKEKEISALNSSGENIVTSFKYPYDFYSIDPYKTMVDKNIITPVIEQISKNQNIQIQKIKTDYKNWGNNIIEPEFLKYQKDIQSPIENRINYLSYDEKGNIISLKKEDDIPITYLWGYNKSLPIAEVKNCNSIEQNSIQTESLFNSSFYDPMNWGQNYTLGTFTLSGDRIVTFDRGYVKNNDHEATFYISIYKSGYSLPQISDYLSTSQTDLSVSSSFSLPAGNYTIVINAGYGGRSGPFTNEINFNMSSTVEQKINVPFHTSFEEDIQDVNLVYAKTGRKSHIGSYSLKIPPASVGYNQVIVSYWGKINVSSPWVYVENVVNTGSVTDYTIGSSYAYIDEVRMYPLNAQMTTYTYDPLIGVTSITDAKGDTITYTYDSFGRLQNVKDKDGNILSENEYHYKN
jgi:YD repeat-containing protein